jgi:hypothetical protein
MSTGLGHRAKLAHRAAFPLLGIPVEIRSNSLAVIAAAGDALASWRDLAPELVAKVPPRIVNIIVQPVPTCEGAPGPFVYRAHGGTFLASDGANLLTAQYDRGRALAFLTPGMLERGADLRENVILQLALLLVTQPDRVPLHAGAVVLEGLAILLAGRSTAGKSTLCYACLREGFQLLTEDAVYISREPRLQIWGQPDRVHLLPDAAQFFPELAGVRPEIQPTGKLKLAIETAQFGTARAVHHAERAIVCVVERHRGAEARLEPIGRAEAVAALSADPDPGFDLYEGAEEVAELLAARGAYRLVVGHDPSEAARVLRDLALAAA